MQRIKIAPRPAWQERARELGFTFHSLDGETYWDESAYYAFGAAEMEREIEDPAQELEQLCRAAVARIVADDALLERLRVPRSAWDLIRRSWRQEEPSLYGRFDFSYTGTGPAKLLEYNADTPTSLYEAAAFQWFWLEDQIASGKLPQGADQYNSIHEKLVARFAELSGQGTLHLACVDESIEDRGTIAYIDECARQGGFTTKFIAMADIGLGPDAQFYDLDNQPIHRLFKLYPWEWMFGEPFAEALEFVEWGGKPERYTLCPDVVSGIENTWRIPGRSLYLPRASSVSVLCSFDLLVRTDPAAGPFYPDGNGLANTTKAGFFQLHWFDRSGNTEVRSTHSIRDVYPTHANGVVGIPAVDQTPGQLIGQLEVLIQCPEQHRPAIGAGLRLVEARDHRLQVIVEFERDLRYTVCRHRVPPSLYVEAAWSPLL